MNGISCWIESGTSCGNVSADGFCGAWGWGLVFYAAYSPSLACPALLGLGLACSLCKGCSLGSYCGGICFVRGMRLAGG